MPSEKKINIRVIFNYKESIVMQSVMRRKHNIWTETSTDPETQAILVSIRAKLRAKLTESKINAN